MAVTGQSIKAEIEWFDNEPIDDGILPDTDDTDYYANNPGTWQVCVNVNGRAHWICGDGEDPMSGAKTVGEAADALAKWGNDRKYTLAPSAISAYLWPDKPK